MKISGVMTVKNGCVTPGHKVLTASLEWKPVEDIKKGDFLVGFDAKRDPMRNGRYYRLSQVQHNIPIKKRVMLIELESGEQLTATEDHPWLVKTGGGLGNPGSAQWAHTNRLKYTRGQVDHIKKYRTLIKFLPVWKQNMSYEAGYLSGFFDGEGSFIQYERKYKYIGKDSNNGYSLQIQASQKNQIVINRVKDYLRQLKFEPIIRPYDRNHRDIMAIRFNGGRIERLRFIGEIRPARFIDKVDIDKLGRLDSYQIIKIKNVRPLGERTVMGLATTTDTYFVDGFGAHNTKFDYPWVEAAESILPICDEFVFCEGYSEDNTMEKIDELSAKYPGKIKVVHYDWSAKHYTDIPKSTNVGIEACTGDYYINLQADEAIHEKYLENILQTIERFPADIYKTPILHFWSSYNKVYRPGIFYDEVYRIARRDAYPRIQSIWDGMTLGYMNGSVPPNYGIMDINFLHYGYVRKPQALIDKAVNMFPWWGYDMDSRLLDRSKGNCINWEATHPEDHLMEYAEGHPEALRGWIEERRKIVSSGALE